MRRLSSLILLVVLSVSLLAQKSPHGDSFKTNCDDCHKTDGWKVDIKTVTFDHSGTKFPLIGQHLAVNCMECHKTLDFGKAQTACNDCHSDIHEQTVGTDCARCHTPNSWVVDNITKLHQNSRFPLVGVHKTAECRDCHKNLLASSASAIPSASRLRFDPLGIECYDCHKANYLATTKPNHTAANYSTNCTDCHNMNSLEWNGAGINHNFFPLTGGHALDDCKKCHTTGVFSGLSNECVTCHQTDYASAANPNHKASNFSTNCKNCHSLTPGWKPAGFSDHDATFPIYSGTHKGEWNSCSDCHTNPANYMQFSCTDCHEHSNKTEVDSKHNGVSGYSFNSIACYGCHPTGSGAGKFDHAAAGFPLTNGHAAVDCAKCHTNGFAGTSNACASCHTNTYNQTTNPNHAAAGISTDCATCHKTLPGWQPVTYPASHSKLNGVHIPIANECATCHKGNYSNAPKLCYDCHAANYTQTKNPSHTTVQFPTTCGECHSQTAWVPSTFNHSSVYPLIGKHATIANDCVKCHANGYANTPNTCAGCHTPDYNQTANPNHTTALFPKTCETCHTPSGWVPSSFNHTSVYPLIGSHTKVACTLCHVSGYVNTPNTCAGCHTPDYNQTSNPNHTTAQFPKTCETCHTPSAWVPSSFNHSSVYPLTGAHTSVACNLCHAKGYANTPNTCVGCHQADFNQSANPSHTQIGISTDCKTCHTTTPGWAPATFATHNTYYVLAGAHISKPCVSCHNGNYVTTPNTCAGCHTTKYNQTTNPNHTAAQFPNTCASCHSQSAWTPSTWNHATYFPITSGKHTNLSCITCHTNTSNYALFSCIDCHEHNQTDMNSKHKGTGGYTWNSAACYKCHPTGKAG
jgi:NMD protein affecting ribosome stability and mRNA decay